MTQKSNKKPRRVTGMPAKKKSRDESIKNLDKVRDPLSDNRMKDNKGQYIENDM